MNYITSREAASKWGISERRVQTYCAQGRILGAKKIGASWGIPVNASKPLDPRRTEQKKAVCIDKTDLFSYFLPLMQANFPLNQCLAYIESLENPIQKELAYLEYYYYTGETEKVAAIARNFEDCRDLPVMLSVSLICVFSYLSAGEVEIAMETLERIRDVCKDAEDTSSQFRALQAFSLLTVEVLLRLSLPEKMLSVQNDIRCLPMGLRAFSMYIYAYYYYLKGEYTLSIGIAETALFMVTNMYPVVSINLRLVAVMSYVGLKRKDRAKEHLKKAWEIARQDQLYKVIGRNMDVLRGVMESVIGKESPEEFERILAINQAYATHWRAMHSQTTGNRASEVLSNVEYSLAILVARGWKNQEIADYMRMSLYTVKRHISNALMKLGIERRQDIKQFFV